MLDARATLTPADAQALVPELDALLSRATEALRARAGALGPPILAEEERQRLGQRP